MKISIHYKHKLFVTAYVLLGMLFSINTAFAQKEVEKIKTYLQANAGKHHLSAGDIQEMTISSAYLSPTTGWYHVYYNQVYQSIEVFNGILNATLVNDKVEHVGNNFVENIVAKVPSGIPGSQLTPLNAINQAATHLGLSHNAANTKEESIIRLANGQVSKAVFNNTTLSNEAIPVKLYWYPYTDSISTATSLHLVWSVEIYAKDHRNYWVSQVDAYSGQVLAVDDQVIKCNFGTPQHTHPHSQLQNQATDAPVQNQTRLTSLAPNSYNVFDYPLESPIHGARTIVTNPYTRFAPAGTGPGATNGWHNDGITDYITTRGNNVSAKEDINADDEVTIGQSPTSATLNFDYPYTQALNTAEGNRNAAITNLFYWNNLIHDILWKYGFDEPSGNYQQSNMGRGGLGNDYVLADAQDGLGLNNAYFAPGVDGQSGRMTMLLWTFPASYQLDSDFDNGIISHEYGHGWSTRLTAGPANGYCLSNLENASEGWSDYLSLMLTTPWSTLTPTVASANIARGMANYTNGQLTTGPGNRPYPYSYDMANVNPNVTYDKVGLWDVPHGTGSIWASTLWDMTWEIIFQDNQIVNEIYNTTNMVGNVAALKLVNEGLRLQKCNPSFIDSRDVILKADSLLFNSRYNCAIWKAFARRGMGVNASTAGSSNDLIVIQDFTQLPNNGWVFNSPTQAEVCSYSVFNYTATVTGAGTPTFSWVRAAVAGISNASKGGNTATISEALINTTNAPITITYKFYLSPSSCQIPFDVNVVVNPSPPISVNSYEVCKDGTIPVGEGLIAPSRFYTNTIGGTIASGNTYWRAKGDNVSSYITSPIGVGNSVYYQTHTFTPTTTGVTSVEVIAAALTVDGPYDTYLSLYQTSFNPASPATNFVAGDDDSGALQFASKITYNFIAGTTYILVVSPYYNGSTGTYQLQAGSNIFGTPNGWYANASGGSALATGDVFNPIGVAGSGVTDTGVPLTKNFYLETTVFSCRTLATFTVNDISIGGSITGSATVCTDLNSGQLTLSGHSGPVARWESSTDNFATVSQIANTTAAINYNNLTQTTQYRAIVKEGACSAAISSIGTITVTTATLPSVTDYAICQLGTVPVGQGLSASAIVPSFSGGLTTSSPTYCRSAGNNVVYVPESRDGNAVYYQAHTFTPTISSAMTFETVEILLTGSSPYDTYIALYQDSFNPASPATNFLMSNDDASGVTLQNASKLTYDLTAGTTYILVVSPYRNNVTGTYKVRSTSGIPNKWYATSSGGTLLSSGNVFNPVGVAGSGFVNTATPMSKTFFVETFGFTTCRVPVTFAVNAIPTTGTISADASFCSEATGTITLAGMSGTILRWESTTDNFATVTPIAVTSPVLNYTNLAQTTYFRAVFSNSSCGVVNSAKSIVNKVAAIPTTTNYAICQNVVVPGGQGLIASAPIYTNFATGLVTTDSPTYHRSIGNRTTVYTPSAAGLDNTYYQTHTFTPDTSGPVTIEEVAGTLTVHPYDTYMTLYHTSFDPANPATNFLIGDDNSGGLPFAPKFTYNLTAGTTYVLVITPYGNGRNGTYQLKASRNIFYHENRWFDSSSGGSPLATADIFNPVGVAGSGILNTATPITKTFYVGSTGIGNCRVPAVFTVNPASVGGSVAGSTTACSNINSGTLTLSGYTGTILGWESSTDNFASNTPVANTTASLNFMNLTQSTQYRAVVQNGLCEAANSGIATFTKVNPALSSVAGSTRCSPGTSILTATGCAGGTVNWYAGISGSTSIATGTSFTTSSLSSTTTYYADCTIGTCVSGRIPVVAAIGTTNATYSSTQTIGNYHVSQTITSSANVATGVNYFAGKAIILTPGFQAGGSEVFSARIQGCL